MKRIFPILLLLILCAPIQAEMTNQQIAEEIVKLLTDSGVNAPKEILENLIDDIVFVLDEKDKAIDTNASIALQWKEKYEEKSSGILFGFSLGAMLTDWKPSILGQIIIFFK